VLVQLIARHRNEAVSQVGIDSPVAHLVGVGQSISRYLTADAHVIKLVALGPKAGFYIAQAFAISQLSEGHAEKLVEAGERLDLAVSLIAFYALPKRVQGKMIDDLRENQLAGGHRAAPVVRYCNPTQDGAEAESDSSR